MSPEITQLIYLALSAVIGWWVRHKGIIGGDSSPASAPATHPILDAIRNTAEKAVLDALAKK